MLTRTTTRRSAVVLTVALIAMVLVALTGSARAAHARTSAGAGQSQAAPMPSRHTTAVAPDPSDQMPWHLDLATTPPTTYEFHLDGTAVHLWRDAESAPAQAEIAAVGRAPPAL